MSRRIRRAALVCAVLWGGAEAGEYAVVADAGSSGTRAYLFSSPLARVARQDPNRAQAQNGQFVAPNEEASSADEEGKVGVEFLGYGPAVSSFKDEPHRATGAVEAQLRQALDKIPEAQRGSTALLVLATAGMRLLPQSTQEAIYAGIRKGLHQMPGGYPFDPEGLQVRTISGREEGVFAFLAANYMSGILKPTLEVPASLNLMGILDLGGASTQVAAPPIMQPGARLHDKLGEEHTFVRSFLRLGMEQMRQKVYGDMVARAPQVVRERRAVANPCAFHGQRNGSDVWRGVGDAPLCEMAINLALREERRACSSEAGATVGACLGAEPVPMPPGSNDSAKFYLISGYVYVIDFARWFLAQPGIRPASMWVLGESAAFTEPTLAELREAALVLCAESWQSIFSLATIPSNMHHFTPGEQVPHRCFELNYIIALLTTGYGFGEHDRIFRIVKDIDGHEIEWSLGAYLHAAFIGRGAVDEL